MKKITMSVAALSIAISSYGQCVSSYKDSLETLKSSPYRILHNKTLEVIHLTHEDWKKFDNEISGFTKFIAIIDEEQMYYLK
tara:strand:+ start:346 stop:591 length:246 start_codon:yes stop_codon:yes gene_type:complete